MIGRGLAVALGSNPNVGFTFNNTIGAISVSSDGHIAAVITANGFVIVGCR